MKQGRMINDQNKIYSMSVVLFVILKILKESFSAGCENGPNWTCDTPLKFLRESIKVWTGVYKLNVFDCITSDQRQIIYATLTTIPNPIRLKSKPKQQQKMSDKIHLFWILYYSPHQEK